MNALTRIRSSNTTALLTTPGLADELALTVGNATFIPSDDKDAPWKAVVIDIDGQDNIFFCKDAKQPKHVKQLLPATSFDETGLAYIFRHCPPPTDFFHLLALDQERKPHALQTDLHRADPDGYYITAPELQAS